MTIKEQIILFEQGKLPYVTTELTLTPPPVYTGQSRCFQCGRAYPYVRGESLCQEHRTSSGSSGI